MYEMSKPARARAAVRDREPIQNRGGELRGVVADTAAMS